jgi:hypothetical protein
MFTLHGFIFTAWDTTITLRLCLILNFSFLVKLVQGYDTGKTNIASFQTGYSQSSYQHRD